MEPAAADATLLPLCSAGHVLVVTAHYPPIPGGSSVIMRNLLAHFHPASYSVVTVGGSVRQAIDMGHDVQLHHIMSSVQHVSHRLDNLWRDWQINSAVSKLVRLVERRSPGLIIGVFPTFHFLKIARETAKITGVPWLAYLHDTVAEGLADTRWANRAIELQEQVFEEADSILVMSRGMADLYEKKYRLSCQPLEHTYPEPIPETLPDQPVQSQAFWGGDVYRINHWSVVRVSQALAQVNRPFVLATKMTPDNLRDMGVQGNHIKTQFYSKRADYLMTLKQQGILTLALNWPDESSKHEDELATIFPTKTPEYLAAGRPILVHCPEHYFLARFFRENKCGLVVSERSIDALERAVQQLLDENSTKVYAMRQAALTTAQLFKANQLAHRFQKAVQLAVESA